MADEPTNDERVLVPRQGRREGDVISANRAILTLSKAMFNAGCFSLPYAWMLGGKWVSFVLTFVIAGLNWYGNHILVRTAQHLAQQSGVAALDYGHFTKRVLDASGIPILKMHSKRLMYCVNVTILFYQLGMCSVAILFISDNMVNLLGDYVSGSPHTKTVIAATIALFFILFTNMFTQIRVISVFAMFSSVFFILGAVVIMQYTISQPSQWSKLPAYTDFRGTILFIGMSMYSFEGQTMILPVENKLEHSHEFLQTFGVLPTTMMLCTLFMTAIGFFGYNAFGADIKPTMTMNVPLNGMYSLVNVFLMLQAMLGHSIALYVVFDMFFAGFRRKFTNRFPNVHKQIVDKGFRTFWVLLTYFMAVLIPRLEILIPLVGVTSGTLCALIYPPILQMISFWDEWKTTLTPLQRWTRIGVNVLVIFIGLFAIFAGLYANIYEIHKTLAPQLFKL
ncbi:Amino acid transporter, transmembrane family-containing protein [Aphelenchoides besseyi]|nr:Amino acid transporter, transmembrane family-containing protein [Aphelenchoides besseyi]KAI6200935.1 Amino acid transporter, transmembrane family-containing protein [Aphelenchoides besseyi]